MSSNEISPFSMRLNHIIKQILLFYQITIYLGSEEFYSQKMIVLVLFYGNNKMYSICVFATGIYFTCFPFKKKILNKTCSYITAVIN